MKTISLRVDVDTLEGSLHGVPRLLDIFKKFGFQASFFFSFGPDNSGKAIRRIFRKGFVNKQFHNNSLKTYGWKNICYGTLLPAPIIYKRAIAQMQSTKADGHEVAIHAWDHVQYHDLLDKKSRNWLEDWFYQAHEAYYKVFGTGPKGAVSPAWRSNDNTLEIQEAYNLDYAGDCRGGEPFYPIVRGKKMNTLQIPTTLPTMDELLCYPDISAETISEYLFQCLHETNLNVFALHAEIEGGPLASTFEAFLGGLKERNVRILTHEECAREIKQRPVPSREMERIELPGRPGWVSWTGERSTPDPA